MQCGNTPLHLQMYGNQEAPAQKRNSSVIKERKIVIKRLQKCPNQSQKYTTIEAKSRSATAAVTAGLNRPMDHKKTNSLAFLH